ncbi:MAG: PDZ domain-containing protein [Chlorobi bacterium]|nr:PDZ domain-containing protein [Chlorobiota bacterium]
MKYFKIIFINAVVTILILLAFFFLTKEKPTTVQKKSNVLLQKQNEPKIKTVSADQKVQAQQSIENSRRTIITETVKKVSPAVVGITVKEVRQVAYRTPFGDDPFFRRFFGDQVFNKEFTGLGSGSIISPDGYILTNDHVAGSADEITVTLSNGKHYSAKRIGTDITTDICLLKIDAKDLPYIPFGNSDDILIGEWVIALGNPFGLFEISDKASVTVGVISATGMNLTPVDNRYYLEMIQTDASINQGNSGGPLVNSIGQLIGMNTLIFTAEGSNGNVGIGFAIPVNKLQKVIKELKKNGMFERNFWTGLRIHSIDEGIAKYYKLDDTKGVIITDIVKNSPASKAGLQVGDIIREVDGSKINNYETLKGVLQNYKTGETISLTVLRNNEYINIKMNLERRP